MQNYSLTESKKHKYKSVSSEERSKIIKYFIDGALSASQISSLTGHNLSTIKAIFRIYRNEGRIKKKDKRDRLTKMEQNVVVFFADDQEKKLKLISKLSLKKEIVLKNGEQIYDSFQDNIKATLLNSTDKLMNCIENLESKIQFDQALKQEYRNGFNEENFQMIPTQQFKLKEGVSLIRGQQMKNICQIKENNISQILVSSQSLNNQILENPQLQELKKVFEQQIQEFYGKSLNII